MTIIEETSGEQKGREYTATVGNSPHNRAAAVRYLASRAHDADDLTTLLAMLNLDAEEAR